MRMTLRELKKQYHESLAGLFPTEEINSFFTLVSSHYLGYSRYDLVINASEVLSESNKNHFLQSLERLKKQEPIQYVLGTTHFFGNDYKVNTHTLIPRPETEELVQWVIDDWKDQPFQSLPLLDLGTGSGCIAITLAQQVAAASVSALDISEETLKIAKENAKSIEVEVDFFQADLLTVNSLPQNYQVMVSNPPYVRELEKMHMQHNVLKYEPQQALFVSDEDPLLFYRHLARLAQTHLLSKGALYLEINEYLGEEMREMLLQEGFASVVLKKDSYGKPRMIKAQRSN